MPSTSACMINVLLWSGCRRTSHHLVEILAKYVHKSSVSAIVDITNRNRSPSLERAQEQSLPPITTSTIIFPLLPELLYAPFSRTSTRCLSHDDSSSRFSNQEPHLLFIISMRTVTFPLGCSLQTTCHPVPPQRQTTHSLASFLPTHPISLPP